MNMIFFPLFSVCLCVSGCIVLVRNGNLRALRVRRRCAVVFWKQVSLFHLACDYVYRVFFTNKIVKIINKNKSGST